MKYLLLYIKMLFGMLLPIPTILTVLYSGNNGALYEESMLYNKESNSVFVQFMPKKKFIRRMFPRIIIQVRIKDIVKATDNKDKPIKIASL